LSKADEVAAQKLVLQQKLRFVTGPTLHLPSIFVQGFAFLLPGGSDFYSFAND